MTPAGEKGFKVGDKFEVIAPNGVFHKGEIIEFYRDDGSSNPWFLKEDGSDYWAINFNSIKKLEKEMNKLDRIEEMRKQLEALEAEVKLGSKSKHKEPEITEKLGTTTQFYLDDFDNVEYIAPVWGNRGFDYFMAWDNDIEGVVVFKGHWNDGMKKV